MSSSHPNGTLSYNKQSYGIKVGRVLYGMEIRGQEDTGQGGSPDNMYASKVFYTRQVFQSTFSIEAIFSTYEEKEDFANWAIKYAQTISAWQRSNWAAYMRVQVPSRKFDFLGILTEGITKNVQVTDVTWTMDLVFRGSMPTPKGGKPPFVGYSSFSPPSANNPNYDPQSIYFYPSDMNLNAAVGSKQDSIYQIPPTSTGALPIGIGAAASGSGGNGNSGAGKPNPHIHPTGTPQVGF